MRGNNANHIPKRHVTIKSTHQPTHPKKSTPFHLRDAFLDESVVLRADVNVIADEEQMLKYRKEETLRRSFSDQLVQELEAILSGKGGEGG